uniref:Uncharacterized protein n=1 Tax=viral metagenome TaxID=1070528 RepID=A0A6C0LDF8_9ZZZZ
MLGLIACGGTASRIFNIPKFILPLKNKNLSLLSNWCMLMIEKGCDKIIIGSSVSNNSFIEHIINTQLSDHKHIIIIKIIQNTSTMNETILKMVENEDYDLAIMGMPDTHVDYISDTLIKKVSYNNDIIIGSYLWNIRDTQREKIGLCNIDDNHIIDIIDKNKDCDYNYGWGAIIFKKEFENYIKIDDLHLGYSMKLALNNSIKIPYEIINGQYWDCGTVSEYKEYLNFLDENKPVYIKGLLIIVAVYIENDVYKLNVLKSCIAQFRNIYKNETIVIIDNKSKNVEWYDLAKSLNIYIIKNNSNLYRYEIGAYNLALKYFRADKYICVQGTMYFNNKITEELDDTKDDAIVFKKTNAQSLNNDGVNIEHIIKKYLNFIDMTDRNEEPLVLWNCFYCNKGFMDNMIEKGILDLICNNKDISCSYERILGTYFHRNLENVKEINPETYHKIFLKQL